MFDADVFVVVLKLLLADLVLGAVVDVFLNWSNFVYEIDLVEAIDDGYFVDVYVLVIFSSVLHPYSVVLQILNL